MNSKVGKMKNLIYKSFGTTRFIGFISDLDLGLSDISGKAKFGFS